MSKIYDEYLRLKNDIINFINEIDINNITPIKALTKLQEIKELINEKISLYLFYFAFIDFYTINRV